MATLQVRDVPESLYDDLRKCASDECRSIANQALYILRDYLRAYRQQQLHERAGQEPPRFVCIAPPQGTAPRPLDPMGRDGRRRHEEEERLTRIEYRERLFARICGLPRFEVPDGFPDPAEMVREDRDSRPFLGEFSAKERS